MADYGGSRSMEKTASLVLSIFKGENFVVSKNTRSACKIFLRAKLHDLQPDVPMESGAVDLTATNTDPEFNSQLAWSVSRKQLKELRSNRSTIKVTCFMVERGRPEMELGYVIMHVKDATSFASTGDPDPSKAVTYPLLGTKDAHWRSLQPKLQMILHLEEAAPTKKRSVNQSTHVKAKVPVPPEIAEVPVKTQKEEGVTNANELAETKYAPTAAIDKFIWRVQEKEGYFLLGEAAPDDDMYILNATVVSASYLHILWDGKSPRKRDEDNYFWQIKYEAYGCEIASEPFLLGNSDESRRTFIGDKATARIRANGGLFFEYLQDTELHFQIIRYQLGAGKELTNPEIMGLGFAPLKNLTDPANRELKLSMEILSEWGTPRIMDAKTKPEIRVLFGLEPIPNFFKLHTLGMEQNNNFPGPAIDYSISEEHAVQNELAAHQRANCALPSDVNGNDVQNGIGDAPDGLATDLDIESVSNTSNVRRLLQFEEQERRNNKSSISSNFTSPEKGSSYKHDGKHNPKGSISTYKEYSDSEESITEDASSNKENLSKIIPPPGSYVATIQLNKFWLKSKKSISDTFVLSYVHPPIGISEPPIEFIAEAVPDENERTDRHGFILLERDYSKTFDTSMLSEETLNQPLTVEFSKVGDVNRRTFACSYIPFGIVFAQQEFNGSWVLEGNVDILKSKNVKIGSLVYKIKVIRQSDFSGQADCANVSQKHSAFFPPPKNERPEPSCRKTFSETDQHKVAKVMEDMSEWRRAQEEIYKRKRDEKEDAFMKILSEEAAKRDAERENAMARKLAELERKEIELNRARRSLEEREEKLKRIEVELRENEKKVEFELDRVQQQSKLEHRRLVENHKIEVDGFKRRLQEFMDEVNKLKTKNLLLEKKLENKEAEIDHLSALKRDQPDVRLEQRVSLLEQENNNLKKMLREASTRKEQYKKQSLALCQKLNRLQDERDHELKDQNENLRLQIIASREHKELKKERKAVQDLSHTLKALKKETVEPAEYNERRAERPVDQPSSSKFIRKSCNPSNVCVAPARTPEDEINRLTEERHKLLLSGAYTKFDPVIKELEKKMVSLAHP